MQRSCTSAADAAQRKLRGLNVHRAADLFPMMSDVELDALGADIEENGLYEPIVLFFDGPMKDSDADFTDKRFSLLDGRNRLEAGARVGFDLLGDDRAHVEIWYLDPDFDPWRYVISANLHRRHLTVEDKARIAAEVLKARPELSNRQVADQVKLSPPKVGNIRKVLEEAGDVKTVYTRTDTKGRQQPARKQRKVQDAGAEPLTRGPNNLGWWTSQIDGMLEVFRQRARNASPLPLEYRVGVALDFIAALDLGLDDLQSGKPARLAQVERGAP